MDKLRNNVTYMSTPLGGRLRVTVNCYVKRPPSGVDRKSNIPMDEIRNRHTHSIRKVAGVACMAVKKLSDKE
jgi:hypothetical protein